MFTADGKQYYRVSEAAKLAGVNTRTLRRWLEKGHLSHFMFPFRKYPGGTIYYRLEPPEDDDRKFEGDDAYRIPGIFNGPAKGAAGNG